MELILRTERESRWPYQKFQHETEDAIGITLFGYIGFHTIPRYAEILVVIMEVQMSLYHKPELKSNRTHMEKNKYYNHTLYLVVNFI